MNSNHPITDRRIRLSAVAGTLAPIWFWVSLAALALLHGTIDVSGHQLLRFGTAVRWCGLGGFRSGGRWGCFGVVGRRGGSRRLPAQFARRGLRRNVVGCAATCTRQLGATLAGLTLKTGLARSLIDATRPPREAFWTRSKRIRRRR